MIVDSIQRVPSSNGRRHVLLGQSIRGNGDIAMSLMDALFYWLQMRLVSSNHPDDEAARETLNFFVQILSEDHEVVSFDVSSEDAGKVYLTYTKLDGTERTVWFDRDAVEQLNRDMFGASDEPDEQDIENEEDTF